MNKIIFFILFLNLAYSQTNNQNDFIGKWQVIENSNIKKKHDLHTQEFVDIFKDALFEFKEDGNFNIVLKSKIISVSELIGVTKGITWKYDAKRNYIMVGTEKDNYSIIGFKFFTKNDESYLKLVDSEVVLKVQKIS
uniref:hypothetical protein n=1 Tax=Flavobacterium sp. TaxID=239 RepID=UPI0040498234